jgi:ribosomal protein S18 acetylase RimI-like enzyme
MQIRPVRPDDEAQLATLLEDHERHYGDPVRPGSGAEGAAFLVQGGTLCLVADDAGALAGFAILNAYFPAMGLTHGLFLKELYVAASARSKGIGEKLIEAIRALAKTRGDTRVIWTTGVDNTGAQRLYDRLGVRRIEKVYYAMDI